jgi:HAD superfamily hydrolase (TIGR01509 family)
VKVLFVDLDGTLADTVPWLYELYCALLASYNIVGTKKEFQDLNGRTLHEIALYLKERYQIPDLTDRYEASVMELYSKVPLFSHAYETLVKMQERGVNCLLVTSANAKLAHHFLKSHALQQFFAGVVTAEGIRGKPSPDIYEKALLVAGTSADEAIAIEDSPHGVEAALAAKILTIQIGVETHFTPHLIQLPNWQAIQAYLTA